MSHAPECLEKYSGEEKSYIIKAKCINRLRHVKDVIPAGTFSMDIDNQTDANYEYDKIGNLIKDPSETISRINWTVYGKIKSLTKGAGINYGYDAGGNRITKKVGDNYTFYIRDAQGNVLGIYEKNNTNFSWAEQQLYGSSRLGTVKPGFTISSSLSNDGYTSTNDPLDNGMIGRRSYDLTNHLGNVLSTIQDSKYGADDDGNGQVDEYRTTVLSARDYYPFGMTMPGDIAIKILLWRGRLLPGRAVSTFHFVARG